MNRYVVSLVCSMAIGCGTAPEPAADTTGAPEPPAMAEPATDGAAEDGVTLVLDSAVVQEGTLHLEGTSSLPDGALLSFEIKHDGFDAGDFDGYEVGTIQVSGGRFTHALPISDWPRGHALIRLTFQMNPRGDAQQPDALIERFGANGERLSGPDVIDFGGSKRVELSDSAEIP